MTILNSAVIAYHKCPANTKIPGQAWVKGMGVKWFEVTSIATDFLGVFRVNSEWEGICVTVIMSLWRKPEDDKTRSSYM